MTDTQLVPSTPGPDDPGRGRRLGFDVGLARIGIASCDPDGILATPVTTLHLKTCPWPKDTLDAIGELLVEYEPVEVVVGLPRTLRNRSGSSVDMVREFMDFFHERWPELPLRLVDERLTTVLASQALHASGLAARSHRPLIDQAAAVEILESWLTLRRKYLSAE